MADMGIGEGILSHVHVDKTEDRRGFKKIYQMAFGRGYQVRGRTNEESNDIAAESRAIIIRYCSIDLKIFLTTGIKPAAIQPD